MRSTTNKQYKNIDLGLVKLGMSIIEFGKPKKKIHVAMVQKAIIELENNCPILKNYYFCTTKKFLFIEQVSLQEYDTKPIKIDFFVKLKIRRTLTETEKNAAIYCLIKIKEITKK